LLLSALVVGGSAAAQTYSVPAGDTAALIQAVLDANADGVPSTIDLGGGEYSLTAPHNAHYGPNGLPVINSDITINGNGSVISRDSGAEPLRFFCVSGATDSFGLSRGSLSLKQLTLSGG